MNTALSQQDGGEYEMNLAQADSHNLHPISGIFLEQSANILTAGRAIGGLALKAHIEATPDYQSWKTVGVFLCLVLTDAEGLLARQGRKLQGKDESVRRPWNAYGDHIADKVLVDGAMVAIANRESANGNHAYANVVKGAAKATIARDVLTTADRVAADYQNIDTRAQSEGKKKARDQYLAIAFALSPLAKTRGGKALAGLGFMYTTKQSVTSGLSLHRSFSEQRKARRKY